MTKKQLGKELQSRRKFLNVTQQALSEISGISLRSLIAIERGEANPTLEHLQKILGVLGFELAIVIKKINY